MTKKDLLQYLGTSKDLHQYLDTLDKSPSPVPGYTYVGPSPLPYATESTKFIFLKLNIQIGQPGRVQVDNHTVSWHDILHCLHLSNCGNASDSNDPHYRGQWQVQTYFQYAE
jgi:hypothetical protein